MKKLLQGFILGYLLFCGLSVWATPADDYPVIDVSGVSYWSTGGGGQLPDGTYTFSGTHDFGGNQILYMWDNGLGGQQLGMYYYPSGWEWALSYSVGWAAASYNAVAWSTWVESSTTELLSGMTLGVGSETNSASTNIIVSANTNDGTWATVITAGVNGSTNITQINVSINSLLGAGDNSGSVFKDGDGYSVFTTGQGYLYDMRAYLAHQDETFYNNVSFNAGRLGTAIDWENMPAFPEFPSDITGSINWEGAPSWFATGDVNVQPVVDEILSINSILVNTVMDEMRSIHGTIEDIHFQQDSDSAWWHSAWETFAGSWDTFSDWFNGEWATFSEVFYDLATTTKDWFVDTTDKLTTVRDSILEDEDSVSVFKHGVYGSSVFKDSEGQSAFVEYETGKSWLSYLKPSESNESGTNPEGLTEEELNPMKTEYESLKTNTETIATSISTVEENSEIDPNATDEDSGWLSGTLDCMGLQSVFPNVTRIESITVATWKDVPVTVSLNGTSVVAIFRAILDIFVAVFFMWRIAMIAGNTMSGGTVL